MTQFLCDGKGSSVMVGSGRASEPCGTARRNGGWGERRGQALPAPPRGSKIGCKMAPAFMPESWGGSCHHHQGTNARGDLALSSWALSSGSTGDPVSCWPAKFKG